MPPSVPLATLLSALDRLPASEEERDLARAMASVCVDEGRSVSAEALIEAAIAETATAQPLAVVAPSSAQEVETLLPAFANRPTQRSTLEAMVLHLRHAHRQKKRWAKGAFLAAFSIPALIMSLLPSHHYSLPASFGIAIVIMISGVGGLVGALGFFGESLDKKACIFELEPHVTTIKESLRWKRSALARAYLRQHTQGEVGLLNGDVAELNKLAKEEASMSETLARIQAVGGGEKNSG